MVKRNKLLVVAGLKRKKKTGSSKFNWSMMRRRSVDGRQRLTVLQRCKMNTINLDFGFIGFFIPALETRADNVFKYNEI